MGWTRRSATATIRLMSVDQREAMAQRVAALMDARGLTNEALAFKAGVATKTVSRILNARHESRAGTVTKIATALGVDEWELRGSPVYAQQPSTGTTPDLSGAVSQLDRIEQKLDALLNQQPANLPAPQLDSYPPELQDLVQTVIQGLRALAPRQDQPPISPGEYRRRGARRDVA